MSTKKQIQTLYEEKGGIFQLLPVFVPRPFSTPGDIGKAQATYSDGGLNITKTLTKKDENLSLQFEAYVTGTVTPIETKPLDIVLVLDVSGSMGNTFTSETRYTYDLITGQSNRYIWWDSDNLYTLLEDGETYVPVEMSREPRETKPCPETGRQPQRSGRFPIFKQGLDFSRNLG